MPIKYTRKPVSASARPSRAPKPKKEQPALFKKKEKALPPAAAQPPAPPAQPPEAALRDVFLPTSQAVPERGGLKSSLRINLGRLLGVLALLVVLALGWVFVAGPGRPALESALLALAERSVSPTSTLTATPEATATLPPAPTSEPSATPRPSRTPTQVPPTFTPTPEFSPTPESACRDISTFTLDDVGREVCAQGTVLRLQQGEGWLLVIFNNKAGSMYWVTYDVSYDYVQQYAPEGACVNVTAVVENLDGTPILTFNWRNLPQPCE